MKSKLIGLIVVLVVIVAAVGYSLLRSSQDVTVLKGYVGGEKIGLLEDGQVKDILSKKYKIQIDYAKAGSLDMITADHTGRNFLFPSSQTALELYKKEIGTPKKSEIILNTPIVLYSHKLVADAFVKTGLVSVEDGVYYMDIARLAKSILANKTWADEGLPALYGNVTVSTTDPTKSNSGNMFAGLLANVLNGGKVADVKSLPTILPQLQSVFLKLGFMETSSSDLFEQFLKTGVGAKPIIAGYENQILEFAVANPDDWAKISGDIVMIYPVPTVWSTHTYIALDEQGTLGINALLDKDIQRIAWEKHGFRTGVYSVATNTGIFIVNGIAKDITKVMPMPDVDTMQSIINGLKSS